MYKRQSVWGAMTAVLLNFLLIPYMGLMGAAISVLLSFAAMALSRILYSRRYIELRNNSSLLIMILLSVLILILTICLSSNRVLYYVFVLLVTISILLINRNICADFRVIYNKIRKRNEVLR